MPDWFAIFDSGITIGLEIGLLGVLLILFRVFDKRLLELQKRVELLEQGSEQK